MAAKWTKIGSLRKSKNGNLYIKVDSDFSLKKDDALNLQDPRKKIASSVEAGRLEESKAEEMLSKIPDYIKYDIYSIEE
jgi:hypothetical protein